MVRVRFAPSPTGYLHVGGLRTALYNYLLARKQGGSFLLRIEDTDRTRYVEGAVENILDCLRWAGVVPDEGASIGGAFGPYVQSERVDVHRDHALRLVGQGHAYRCFCTPERLTAMRGEREARGESTQYDGLCRSVDPQESQRRAEAGEPHVVRMRIPAGETVTVDDLIRGPVAFETSLVDDQVLLKSDGYPTYHLAAIVDDHLMEITHVIRGEEWLSSTPKHLLLYRYFGWEPPRFAHLPLILNAERKKLSKRDGDVSVEAYREKGYLPEALVNFLALLGWNPGDERELFTLEGLVDAFSLERVNKSGSIFDLAKLDHLNGLHIRALPTGRIVEETLPYFQRSGLPAPDAAYLGRVIERLGERLVRLTDVVEEFRYFFADPAAYDPQTVKKRWKEGTPQLLSEWAGRLADTGWTAAALEESLRALAEEQGVGAGQVIHPVRLALSGMGSGPGLFEMMETLGRETCLRRMRAAAERIAREAA